MKITVGRVLLAIIVMMAIFAGVSFGLDAIMGPQPGKLSSIIGSALGGIAVAIIFFQPDRSHPRQGDQSDARNQDNGGRLGQ